MTEPKKKEIKSTRRPQVSNSCIGCWACVAISPDVFEFDDEYISKVKKLDNYEWKWVEDCIDACPVNAIKWIDIK